MDEKRALLNKIFKNNDDLSRLLFADWVDKHHRMVECGWCWGGGYLCAMAHLYTGSRLQKCPTCCGTGRVSNGNAERAGFIRVQ